MGERGEILTPCQDEESQWNEDCDYGGDREYKNTQPTQEWDLPAHQTGGGERSPHPPTPPGGLTC